MGARSVIGLLTGAFGKGKGYRHAEALTDEEILQLDDAMMGIKEWEPIKSQNEVMSMTRGMAEELLNEAGNFIAPHAGGPMSIGPQYDRWKELMIINDLIQSPIIKGAD